MNTLRAPRQRVDDARSPAAAARPAAGTPPRPHVAVPAGAGPAASRRRVPAAATFFIGLVALLVAAYVLPSSAYLSPQSGAGYGLGIAGGSMMLLLLLYPLRKRLPRARFLGPTRTWFQAHMTLGLLGPALILLHANFSLGATNSNVALVCMLVVAGSGLFGRYFHGRIHLELHGRQATLEELKAWSGRLRLVTSAVSYLPELARRIDAEEDDVSRRAASTPLLLRPCVGLAWSIAARRRLRRVVRRAVADGADRRRDPARDPLQASAFRYIDDRIGAARRVLEFHAFERFFSLWHALHLPLFVMLVIAGVAHVVAVHLY